MPGWMCRIAVSWLAVAMLAAMILPVAALQAATTQSPATESEFPGVDWAQATDPGLDPAALTNLFEYTREQNSTGLVIVRQGRMLAERYWPDNGGQGWQRMLKNTTEDGRTLEDVASVQKSVVAFLIGVASGRGLLDVGDPVSSHLGAGWSQAPGREEALIRIQHLLSMTSGLDTKLGARTAAGARWQYNTRAYSRLVQILEQVSGQDIHHLTREWLTDPAGMTESSWQPREWLSADIDANTLGFVTSARDLARFGLLMAGGGHWKDRDLTGDQDYLARSIRTSQTLNPAYGYLWWLNGQPLRSSGGTTAPSLAPSAPSDLYAAQGALGRKLYVVPSLDLVVVRLGDQPERDFNQQFWRRLMAALPESAICNTCEPPLAWEDATATSTTVETISWREHVIDDPTRGVADLSGSDGLAMADLDGDGFEDIVSVHESDTVYDGKPIGHVRIAWGTSDPHQWVLSTLASGVEAAAAEDVTIADVNGDGAPDVLVACELAHLIYFQNPGPSRARSAVWPRTIPAVTRDRGSYIRAFFADFDGDGRPEVAAANKGEQNPDVAATDALNNLSIFHIPADPLNGDAWREQVLGRVLIPINAEPVDLDGDGDLDVVAGSRGEARILWFENRGNLTFVEHDIQIEGAPDHLQVTGFNMDYADLNDDGRTDIVSTAWPGALLLLTQPESFDDPWTFSLIGSTPPDQLVSVRLADIDSDGDLDAMSGAYSRGPRDRDGPLVSVNDPMGRIVWFENRASDNQGWQPHTISRRKRGMYDKWLFRDLDGDGDLDALGTRGNSEPYDGVIWLEQLRTSTPERVFQQARVVDSQQMGPVEQ